MFSWLLRAAGISIYDVCHIESRASSPEPSCALFHLETDHVTVPFKKPVIAEPGFKTRSA